MSKIGFISLGCSKNLIDTEIMLSLLVKDGHEIVAEEIHADIIIINTCAFIESAKKEAIDNILDVAWLKENRTLRGIIVCGCLAQRVGSDIFKELPEVDAVIGVGSIYKITEAVNHINNSHTGKYISAEPPESRSLDGDRVLTTPEYTAYIKISEGCGNRCSYCAIPDIRGNYHARGMEAVVNEARDLVSLGVRELIVIAQDTTAYTDLPQLLRRLCAIDELVWIRLLYCYPDKITDELIDVIKTEDKIVKYIDMPIQHINNDVLKAMNRKSTKAGIIGLISKLRTEIPGIILRSTVIVGFPGETKAQFTELADFLKEMRFERLGAFAYSDEEGTPAYKLSGKIKKSVKDKRLDIIMQNQNRILYEYNSRMLGTTLTVLCEGFDKVGEIYYGRSSADAPEIDCKIYFKSNRKIRDGEFVRVIANEIVDVDLIGEAAE